MGGPQIEAEALKMRRFRLVRRIGAGGMGVVFEAFDRELRRHVALKTLLKVEPKSILRLKHEFRSLQDLDHPNLVRFRELFESNGNWFFTMDLIDGVDFLRWVSPDEGAVPQVVTTVTVTGPSAVATVRAGLPTDDSTVPTVRAAALRRAARLRERRGPASFNEERLRHCLAQLARALIALHDADKVHRDIKPSNILVRSDGQLFVLDFGLVSDLLHDRHQSNDEIAGTVPFMAPEQTTGESVGPAADWYAVGALLYLALTGEVPLRGATRATLFELKRTVEPPPPSSLHPGVPADLDALCRDLLRIAPERRPTGREVLRRLGLSGAQELEGAPLRPGFVGRQAELSELQEAFVDMHRGQTVIQLVHGESGVGKSTLVRRFTEMVERQSRDMVVLAGRCYERESLPYKAVDEIVDDLSRCLAQFSPTELSSIVPQPGSLLPQAFPVLLDVDAFALAPRPLHEVKDPQERRQRVFTELRELLTRLAARRPLVLVIDDLQWGDADSLALLSEILRPPNAPVLLLIATVREASESAPSDRRGFEAWWSVLPNVRHIHLSNLPPEDAIRMVSVLAPRGAGEDELDASTIASESGGHPLFIEALIRQRALAGGTQRHVGLEEALRSRIAMLEPLARHIVEVVAVSGRPLAQGVVMRAAGADIAAYTDAVAALRHANLVRTGGARSTDVIEAYHQRVRVAVRTQLEPTVLARCHERLALALESVAGADAEALAVHWEGAGNGERAAHFALAAAAQAAQALAFERAASLYRTALAVHSFGGAEKREIQTRFGEALALAGRSSEAAEVFRDAAATAKGAEVVELKRRAAEQLLTSGRIDEGLSEVETVLAAAGLSLPRTPRRAVVSLLLRRARIRLRGVGFRERDASELAPSRLKLIDLTFSLSQGLVWVDVIRGAEFQSRHVLLALAAGEPYRLARALAIEAGFAATSGGRGPERALRLLEIGAGLANKTGNPHAIGFMLASSGFAALAQGRWAEARDLNRKAEAIFAERCVGVPWELAFCRVNMMWGLSYHGDLRELWSHGQRHLRTALDRGDLFAGASMLCGPLALGYLYQDDPATLHREIDDVMKRWSQKDFHLQHLYALVARTHADLYAGDAEAAYRRLVETWPHLRRSFLLHFQITRIMVNDARARCAASLAAVSTGAKRARLLHEVERLATKIAAERLPTFDAIATMLRARHALLRGHAELGEKLLGEAVAQLEAADTGVIAAAARRCHGLVLGGSRGDELIAAADAWLTDQGVRDPARAATLFAAPAG